MKPHFPLLAAVALIAMLLCAIPVSAENIYVDRNPALYEVLPPDAYGYVVFYIRAGGSAQDLNVYIKRDDINATFDPYYHPDKTVIKGQNPDFEKITVLSDGVSDIIGPRASGCWTAYIQKGNGDQMETQHFILGGGATERVSFLGDAVTSPGEAECKKVYKITEATYGRGECWNVTIVDKEAWDETVTDVQPWAETIYHPEVNHTVHHDAITHEQFVVDGHYDILDSNWFWDGHHFVLKVKCSNHVEHGNGWHVQTAACTEAYGHYETVIDQEAWDEIVVDTQAWTETIDHPAQTHVVHHPAITHEETVCNEMVDVTAPLNGIVGAGTHQFLFDTSGEVGGIFSTAHELLYEMANPSQKGFVNTANVAYEDGCGNSNVLTGTDLCVFDIEAGTVTCESPGPQPA